MHFKQPTLPIAGQKKKPKNKRETLYRAFPAGAPQELLFFFG